MERDRLTLYKNDCPVHDRGTRISMILYRTRIKRPLGSAILPKGDRYDVPPGRRQFRLSSLFGLLTAGALVAAVCRWLNLEPLWTLIFETYVVVFWWNIAQLRVDAEAKPAVDQSELRVEVRRWLLERERR